MKAISFIKKHAMVVFAGAAIIGFSSFKLIDRTAQSEVTFIYTPGAGDTPYEQSSVENSANWEPGSPCSNSLAQDKACSIKVPFANTMNGGTELDPAKVSIESQEHLSSGQYRVITGSSSTGYSDPVNRPLN